MCVILVSPANARPDRKLINACHAANPHGAGVAWREGKEVHWMKNLSCGEVETLVDQIAGECVIHFRWASVGKVCPELCHPFPVDRIASTRLSGSAQRVLFHNGTWSGWQAALEYVEDKQDRKIGGPMSDSRAVALLVAQMSDPNTLKHISGRFVLFSPLSTKLYGDWRSYRGMRVSNLNFMYELERDARDYAEPELNLED
jgi:hypothetical protein